MVFTNITPFPSVLTPITNISPLTYRDASTFLEYLETIKKWLNETLVPETDTMLDNIIVEFQAAILNAENTINSAKGGWQELFNEFMENVVAELEGLNEGTVKDLIKNKFAYVSVTDYGADGDGVADDTAAINAAIAAVADGGTVLFPPGIYSCSGKIVNAGKSVTLYGNGATLLVNSHTGLIEFTGSWGTVYPVSAVAAGTVVNTNAQTRNVLNLTVPGILPYKQGEVVKVFSDDVIPGARPGSGGMESRCGQTGVVYAATAGNLSILAKELIDPMTTNIRVAKLNNITATIQSLTIDTAPALMVDGEKNNTVLLTDLYRPVVKDVVFKNTTAQALQITAYGYTVENVEISNSTDNTANNQYGYGVLDNSGSMGTVSNLRATYVRHAYSDDSPRIAVDSAPTFYGRSYGNTIINGKSFGTSDTSWDTHAASQGASFENCKAYGSGGPGFALRGRKHTITGGSVSSGRDVGIYIFAESGTNTESHSHVITGVEIESPVSPVLVALNKLSNVRETRKTRFDNIRVTKPNDLALQVVNATVDIGNIFIDDVQMSTAAASTIKVDNSAVAINNLKVGYKAGLANNTPTGILMAGGSNLLIADAYIDINGTTNGTRFANYIVADANSVFRIPSMLFTANPTGVCEFHLVHADSYIDYKAPLGNGLGISASYITWSSGSPSNPQHALSRSFAPHIIYAGNISSAYTLNAAAGIRFGRYAGQKITIVNTGVADLTINNAYNISTKTGAAITVAPKQSADFAWFESAWVQI